MADHTCSVDGCDRVPVARGWCLPHWKKWRRWGTPTPIPPTTEERFFSHVVKQPDGCWLWTPVDPNGYGLYFYPAGAGTGMLPHRWAYERFVAPIPYGLVVDHLCAVRNCVRPEHLEVVTQRTNVLRSANQVAKRAASSCCIRGHEFTPENTYIPPKRPSSRQCRECARERDRRRKTE